MGLFKSDAAFRRRLFRLLVTEFVWGVGTFFVLPTTTVPAFLTARGATPVIVGLMATAMGALPLLFQFFGRGVLDRFRNRRLGVIRMHIPIILPYAALAVADLLLAGHPRVTIGLCIVFLGISQIALGVVTPVWIDMIARIIPLEWRGRYFGFSSGAFALGGIAGSSALYYLERLAGAYVFPAAFAIAAVFFALSIAMFAAVPVTADVFQHPVELPLLARVGAAARACHWRTDFGRLIASYAGVLLAAALVPFIVVYATDGTRGLGYPASVFTRLTVLQAMGGAASAITLGWLVDHHGPRWPWVCATLVMPVVVVLLPYGGWWPLLAACALLAGALSTHWSISAPALLEFSPDGDKSAYVAMANIVAFVPASLGPLIYGGLIQRAGFEWAFVVAGVAGLAAAVPAMTLRRRVASFRDAKAAAN